MNKISKELSDVAKIVAVYRRKSEFTICKPLLLHQENCTSSSLKNATAIKEAGYELVDFNYTWNANRGPWRTEAVFIRDGNTVTHIFEGFSIGYWGEGTRGFLEFGKIFGYNFNENKVTTKELGEEGKDVPMSAFM